MFKIEKIYKNNFLKNYPLSGAVFEKKIEVMFKT
jgi:hypothetical protein